MVRKLSILCLLTLLTQFIWAQKITGVVVDATTGEPLSNVTLFYKGLDEGTISSLDGRFTVNRHEGWTLHVTYVGYIEQQIVVNAQTPDTLTLKMQEYARELSEVLVKPGRYTRRNNPAVELMRKVIAARKRTDLENYDYYQYNKYQKITLALNDYKSKDTDSINTKKFKWNEHTEISAYNGKVILPISVDETVKQHVYRKNPKAEKDIVQGVTSTGINQLMVTGDMMNTMLKEAFQDVDIYEDYVRLVQFPFPSPIGSAAIGFYHFYIEDTVYVDKQECYHLKFYPNNQQDFGFNGDLYVLTDSTLHIKRCNLTLPKRSDVNYVKDLHIDQIFSQLDNGEWVLTHDDMWAEMTLLGKNLLVVRNTRLSDYAFDELPKSLFSGKAKEKTVADARNREDDFWDQYRTVELTGREASVSSFVDQLRNHKGTKVPLFFLKLFIENYIETGSSEKPSKFDFGPMLSSLSSNSVDGFRARIGGRTTANLNPHLFFRGYYSHGFKSNKNYYLAEVTYSLNKKRYTTFEFPQRNIAFESSYDVMSPSDKFLYNDKDNALMGFRVEKVDQMYYYNRQKLTFTYETDYGLNISTHLKTESDEVAGNLHFIHVNDGTEVHKIRTTEYSLGIIYSPGRTYINTKQRRRVVNYDNPVITLRHTLGLNGFLGGQYTMNQTDLNIYKRQWLGSFGYIDLHLDASIQWNKLPFPLLMTPPISLTYIEQEGTFNMLHNMELFMDRKVFWSLSWNLNGKLFNRIPLLKKLKLREYISFKGIWGKLSDKNNPTLIENAQDNMLFYLPEGSYPIDPGRPYMELAAGIHNILNLFSVEWVHRFSYFEHPKIKKNGIRFGLRVSF